MIVRETDRLVASNTCAYESSVTVTTGVAIAPTVDSSKTIYSPFLKAPDQCIRKPAGGVISTTDLTVKVHGAGSNILFADGHVKLYSAAQFFRVANPSGTACWDTADAAFYNTTQATYGAAVQKAIQITP